MKTPTVSAPFNANPNKTPEQIAELASQAPSDAAALVGNLGKIYKQGEKAYQWSDRFAQDTQALMHDGRLAQEEVHGGRPAFEVYETRRLGPANKAQYISGQLVERNNKLYFKMDGGRELTLAASGRMPHDHRGEVRKDFIGGFIAAAGGDSPRVRLKGTLGSDGRFNVEAAVPELKGWETFEEGRLFYNRTYNWVELQTCRGHAVVTDPVLLEDLRPLLMDADKPTIGVMLPGEARAPAAGGLVYGPTAEDPTSPYQGGSIWWLGGFARMRPNVADGPRPDLKISLVHFGFSTKAGVPVVYPAELVGRIERNTVRRGDGMWGDDAVNGRFWVFGKVSRGDSGELGIRAEDLSEQTDCFYLEGNPAPDADGADVVTTFGVAEELGDSAGPILSTRPDR